MKVYKNLWAGHETYFIRLGTSGIYAVGIGVVNVKGEWKVNRNAHYFASDLRNDREHFPIVGNVDLNGMIIDAIKRVKETVNNGNG